MGKIGSCKIVALALITVRCWKQLAHSAIRLQSTAVNWGTTQSAASVHANYKWNVPPSLKLLLQTSKINSKKRYILSHQQEEGMEKTNWARLGQLAY